MSAWNCKRMARVISLYVAGDLVGTPERKAAAHLAACEHCSRIATEFSGSNQMLLESSALPEFGAEFYAGIRSAVLGEIKQQRVSRRFRFAGRWIYATSITVAIIGGGILLQHYRTVPKTPDDLAFNISPPAPGGLKAADSSPAPRLLKLPTQASHRRIAVRKADAQVTDRVARADASETMPSLNRIGRSVFESGRPPGAPTSSPSGLGSKPEVSRIEIRTSDPNIRIIWLAPAQSRSSEPTNHDQIPPENGDRN